jgi:hypothetical protein
MLSNLNCLNGLQGVLADVELLQEITMASRAAVGAFVEDRTDKDGNVSSNALTNLVRLGGLSKEPYIKAIEVSAVTHYEFHDAMLQTELT